MIRVIGAGPSGCMVAYHLARSGYDVTVHEEHPRVGLPVQCAGILTDAINKIFSPPPRSILNRVSKVCVHAPDNTQVSIPLHKKELIIDRHAFDESIAYMAVDAGAKLLASSRCAHVSKDKIEVKDKSKDKNRTYDFSHLIGADGPLSKVRDSIHPRRSATYLTGVQALIKKECAPDEYHVYMGSQFPNFFGWAVPESDNVMRVGIASSSRARHIFDSFYMSNFKESKIIETQGGVIPIYQGRDHVIEEKNKFLLGDAALQIKNSTGGGIVPGLKAASILAESITEKKSYTNLCKKHLYPNLDMHRAIRNTLDRFTDSDYNMLVRSLDDSRIKKIISDNDRESPLMLLISLALRKPSLLSLARRFAW